MFSFTNFLENYINFNDYSLEHKFQYYNRLLFDNAIPPCPITWATLKGAAGMTYFMIQGRRLLPGSLRIEINTRFKSTEQRLDATLIHEMIHAYLATHGNADAGHGPMFRSWALSCGHKVGFTIALNDEINNLELTDDEKILTTVVVLKRHDGHYYANFYSATQFDSAKKMDELVAFWSAPTRLKNGEEMFVVKIMSSLISKYGLSRSINQTSWPQLSKVEQENILQHGQIIRHIEPNSMSFDDAASRMPSKETLVVMKTDSRTGETTGTFLMPGIAKDRVKMTNLITKWEPYPNSGYDVDIFTTRTSLFSYKGFTMFRDVSKGSYYVLKPDSVAELRKNANYIRQWKHQ